MNLFFLMYQIVECRCDGLHPYDSIEDIDYFT